MKLNKFFMLGLAGLAFAACSNDDEVTSAMDGDAMVRVNIVTAGSTRAVTDPVDGTDFATQEVVVNKIRLKLTAGTVTGNADVTFDQVKDGKTVMQQAREHTFTGVRNPQKMEIFINDGVEKMGLSQVINTKLAAPMYASADAKDFNLVKPEESGNKNYKVKTYEVTLKPQHKTALLEFSGIKHAEDNGTCAFEKMTFKGIFMNKIAENENDLKKISSFNDWNAVIATGTDYIWDEVTDGTDFLTSTVAWPKENKCYAYNVFGNTETLPILTLYFDNIETKKGFDFFHGATTGYAAVAKYKLNVDGMPEVDQTALGVSAKDPYVKTFVPGYIYRIKNIVVPDSAIGPTPAGGEDVNVLVVEVTVNPWKLVSGTVEWN